MSFIENGNCLSSDSVVIQARLDAEIRHRVVKRECNADCGTCPDPVTASADIPLDTRVPFIDRYKRFCRSQNIVSIKKRLIA